MIGGKKKEILPPLEAFAESVRMRDRYDLIVRGRVAALVLLMPLITLGILELLIHSDFGNGWEKFSRLIPYESAVIAIPIMVESFVVMFMSRKMYVRLADHSKRDCIWRESLIRIADQKGYDTAGLNALEKKCRRKEHFRAKTLTDILLLAVFLFLVWAFLYGIPDGSLLKENMNIVMMVAASIAVCVLMFTLIFFKTVGFAYKHEKAQADFTAELAGLFARDGIRIRPMAVIVSKGRIILSLFLMYFTAGAWTIILLFRIFRSANNHIANQWVYEEELLTALESNGERGFRQGIYEIRTTDRSSRKDIRFNANEYRMGAKSLARKKNKMPLGLVIAELFLLVICATYILKLIGLVCDLSVDYSIYRTPFTKLFQGDFSGLRWGELRNSLLKMGTVVMNLAFLALTIGSLLGIASRRSASWRKVARSCVTFAFPTVLALYTTTTTSFTGLFTLNPYITVAVLWDILLLMIVSHNIREYYAPVGIPMPPVTKWIAFILYGSLESASDRIPEIGSAPAE